MPFEPTIAKYVQDQQRLLDMERQAEIDESVRLHQRLSDAELESRGRCLTKLKFLGDRVGFGGRTVLELGPSHGDVLPPHRIQSGDVVTVSTGSADRDPPTAVIARVFPDVISIALDQDLESELRGNVRLDKVANDVTYRRLSEALRDLAQLESGSAQELRDVCFGLRELDPQKEELQTASSTTFFDGGLNRSQCEAVLFALDAPQLALIHGPPGTGKTRTLTEFIRQAVGRGEKVLACAPSNVAVDNLTERLDGLEGEGLVIVRVGHPARLLESVVHNSLDSQVERSESTKFIQEMRREADFLAKRLRRTRDFNQRETLRYELRSLRRGIREFEDQTVRGILAAADVVLTTNTGAGNRRLNGIEFDRVVIDEAAQALECSCWIPLQHCGRVVLAGDHKQLPPTVRSRDAEREGLGATLFERCIERYPQQARLLSVQYRMHEQIMNWSSQAMYEGALEAHESVRQHRLGELPTVDLGEDLDSPLLFIDTAGFDAPEKVDAQQESRWNPGEATLLKFHLERLLAAGVLGRDIAVITPYNAQVDRLRRECSTLAPDLEIDTVDGFQGREKEAVLLSLVRSNERSEVGFLAEPRRLNVAITRARRHVAIVADSATIANDSFLAELVDYLQEHALYLSAYEIDTE